MEGGTHHSQVSGSIEYRGPDSRLRWLSVYGKHGMYSLRDLVRRCGGHVVSECDDRAWDDEWDVGVSCEGAWPSFLKGTRRPAGLARAWEGWAGR